MYLVNHKFEVVTTKKSWLDARAHCQNLNGDLASFKSEEEVTEISYLSSEWKWIGLNDKQEEGKWVWSDGSTTTWTEWSPNQPNGGTQDNCALLKEGPLDDWGCSKSNPFICKIQGIHLYYASNNKNIKFVIIVLLTYSNLCNRMKKSNNGRAFVNHMKKLIL